MKTQLQWHQLHCEEAPETKSWDPPVFLPLCPGQTTLFIAMTLTTYYTQHSVACFLASLPTFLDCVLPG